MPECCLNPMRDVGDHNGQQRYRCDLCGDHKDVPHDEHTAAAAWAKDVWWAQKHGFRSHVDNDDR